MGFLGKPVGGTGIHRYYGDGFEKPNRAQKVGGHRKARYAAKRELRWAVAEQETCRKREEDQG